MAKGEKDRAWPCNRIYQLWNFAGTNTPATQEDNRIPKKIRFIHYNKQAQSETPSGS